MLIFDKLNVTFFGNNSFYYGYYMGFPIERSPPQ